MTRSWTKWIPAVAIPAALIATGAIVAPLSANAEVNLPAKTPAEVVALLAASDVDALSGDFAAISNLGLPELPAMGGSGDSSATDLLTGTHSGRVFRDGSENARIQVMEQLAERDVIRNGDDLWLYSSDDNEAVHAVLPNGEKPAGETPTPDQLGTELVNRLESSSTLSVTTAQRIAGRAAYTLVLQPKATDTLIGSVAVAVDAATGLALSVEATARGASDPAVSLAFTSLSLETPAAGLFDFTPPSDATVKEKSLDGFSVPSASSAPSNAPRPTVTGSGWDAIIALETGSSVSKLTSSAEFRQLSTAVDGGRLIHTALVNIFITDGGQVLAGSVPVEKLQAAASE